MACTGSAGVGEAGIGVAVGGAIVLSAGMGGVTSPFAGGAIAGCGVASVWARIRALLIGLVTVACGEGWAGSLSAGAGNGAVASGAASKPGGLASVGSLAATTFGAGALNNIPDSYA